MEGFTMQIKLQSDDYHVLLNTLGAELNSYSSPTGKEYIWNSDPAYWLRSSSPFFSYNRMSAMEKQSSKIIYTQCPNMDFVKNPSLK